MCCGTSINADSADFLFLVGISIAYLIIVVNRLKNDLWPFQNFYGSWLLNLFLFKRMTKIVTFLWLYIIYRIKHFILSNIVIYEA